MAMWQRVAIFTGRGMQTDFKLYKVDMEYIRNLHDIDNKVLSVSPQAGKDNKVFVGIVIICGIQYCAGF
ncbi:MAG: type III toxin-antitoxin system ToxN/AbiQ family toxin [Muribaculum sp.]|nr:type III toxin-antitoxin system ToxN/AbiQ family toxin [Muribaculum sp.]